MKAPDFAAHVRRAVGDDAIAARIAGEKAER
jgi:hypothetical protein